jgi:IS30 family transposase
MTKRTSSHLLGEQKGQIVSLPAQDAKISDIAKSIGRKLGTFSQELNRENRPHITFTWQTERIKEALSVKIYQCSNRSVC